MSYRIELYISMALSISVRVCGYPMTCEVYNIMYNGENGGSTLLIIDVLCYNRYSCMHDSPSLVCKLSVPRQ